MQVVLWAVFGATMGLAALEVRHRRLAGSFDLSAALPVDLSGGGRASVRLPRGWAIQYDKPEHGQDRRDPSILFIAREAAGPDGTGGSRDGRLLTVRCQRLTEPTTSAAFLDQGGLLQGTVPVGHLDEEPDEPGGGTGGGLVTEGSLTVAGSPGVWRLVFRGATPLAMVGGASPEYVAAGVVPSGWGVSVVLDCPVDPMDAEGDRELIRRVAAAIVVVPAR